MTVRPLLALGCRYRENGSTPKQHAENMYSTKVVVGTTRSKRLVRNLCLGFLFWLMEALDKCDASAMSTIWEQKRLLKVDQCLILI